MHHFMAIIDANRTRHDAQTEKKPQLLPKTQVSRMRDIDQEAKNTDKLERRPKQSGPSVACQSRDIRCRIRIGVR